MFLIRDFWALILLLIFGFSPGARAAVGNLTTSIWLAARNAATHLWNSGGRPLMEWTVGALLVAVLTAWVGVWWFPARVAAPVLLIIWFLLVRAGVNATIRVIETATVAVLEPLVSAIKGLVAEPGAAAPAALPEAEVEEARKSLVEALRAGVRPITWLVVCAALWGIQIVVFPHISGTTGLFVIFVVVALNLLGSLLGRVSRLPERAAQFFVLVAIMVFAIELPLRNTLPGAAALELLKQGNRQSTAFVRKLAGGRWKGAVSGEHADGLEREFNRPFRSSLYEDFWQEKPKIFNKDGIEITVGSALYDKVIKDLESRPFVVVRDESVPEAAKKAVGETIDLAVIQASPSRPDDKYIVPSRCLDLKSESRGQAARQTLRASVETRDAEIVEAKAKQMPKVRIWKVANDFAWFWRLTDVKKNEVGPLEYPPLNSAWEVRGEIQHKDLPDDIKNLEGAQDMLFLKVSSVKNPAVLYIIRDQWGGSEVANPLPF